MTKIAICQRKGGCGKTTGTLNIAHGLALEGNRVLVVDLDDQQNTSNSISIVVTPGAYIDQLLIGDDVEAIDLVQKTGWENVSIIPASANLSGTAKHLDGEVGGHLVLQEKLASLEEHFDYILLDTGPSLNILVVNALCAADYLFIPLISKYFALEGLKKTLAAYKKITKRIKPELKLLGIAFVIHDMRSKLANEVVEKLQQKHPQILCKHMIGVNIKIEEAQVKKQSIFSYKPDDKGADQYRKLVEEITALIDRGYNGHDFLK